MKYYEHTLPNGRKIEAIDIIEHMALDFNQGNIIKYIARAGRKSKYSLQDITKAYYYAKRAVVSIDTKGRTCTEWRILDMITSFTTFNSDTRAAQYLLYDVLTQSLSYDSLKDIQDYLHRMYDHAVVADPDGTGVMITSICKKTDMCTVVALDDPALAAFEVSIHDVSSPIKYVNDICEDECCEEFYNAYCDTAGN